jgi:hypothetical protein
LEGRFSRFSQVFVDRPGKLKAQIRRFAGIKNPLLLSQKRAATPFSGIYKAPASSQIGADE